MRLNDLLRVVVREVLLLLPTIESKRGIPVLLYHNTSDNNSTAHIPNVKIKDFEEQIKYLSLKGYITLTIDDIRGALTGKKPLPTNGIVITFDDGYKSNMDAFKVLHKYGYTSICFIPTAFIGGWYNYMPFCIDGCDVSYETSTIKNQDFVFLSPEDINEANDLGVVFCSHTHRHVALTDPIDQNIMLKEIRESLVILENLTGVNCKCFSYPVGKYNLSAKEALTKCGIDIAFSVDAGQLNEKSDPLLIPRVNVVGNMRMFRLLLSSKYAIYDKLSKAANK